MDWTTLIAPLAALLGVTLGQQLQKRRELSVRAQQLREEMLLDLAEWAMQQLYLVPTPAQHYDAEGNLIGVYWPTNSQAADRGEVPKGAEKRLLMRVKLYGSPKLFKLAQRASGNAENSGGIVLSRRSDIVGPSSFYPTFATLKELWAQLEDEVGAQRKVSLLSRLRRRRKVVVDQEVVDAELERLTIMSDKRWWNSYKASGEDEAAFTI
ncbi:hypothetical protein ACFYE2_14900 [Kocuria sp. CPCC 205300]|uniref:hypothetical protein n=1 Tax=Kocuria sabuli TaxID=3071448 RepID=UPI0036DA5928